MNGFPDIQETADSIPYPLPPLKKRQPSSYYITNTTLSGIKHKVENKQQYEEYLEELKGLREELGVNLKEDLYPEGQDSPYYNP